MTTSGWAESPRVMADPGLVVGAWLGPGEARPRLARVTELGLRLMSTEAGGARGSEKCGSWDGWKRL